MVMMEGILWKWTNYLSGWQQRWFVLDYGVLGYYRSPDEIHLGSRGSVKMSCCEILINNSDPVRIDLKIPPESFMYLKASTSAERQKWLVALGTAKACLVDSNVEEQQQQMNSMNFLKDKMKELNLCRNIMLEQIKEIKSFSGDVEGNKPIVEAVTLLSATCDTFSNNLDDVMEILEDNLSTLSASPVSTPRLNKPPIHHKHRRTPLSPSSTSSTTESDIHERDRSSSAYSSSDHSTSLQSDIQSLQSPMTPNQNKLPQYPMLPEEAYRSRNLPLKEIIHQQMHGPLSPKTDSSVSSCSSVVSSEDSHRMQHQLVMDEAHIPAALVLSSPDEKVFVGKSFFGKAPARFEDVRITSAGLIPTQIFLEACSNIIPVFDSLGPTAFAPVKIDIQGNIQKIQLKFETQTNAFEYLQNIVFQELKSNEHNARNSTTDALLWLKRALEFILVFLSEVSKGERDLAIAAGTAYSKSLKRYHGWIVRGVFNLAVKACPYYKDFIKALSSYGVGPTATEQETLAEMTSCVDALSKIVNKLNSYYKKNKLDSDSVV